ncbi:hypothetical protein FRB99_001529, partial [Tulasnella sp. 403]
NPPQPSDNGEPTSPSGKPYANAQLLLKELLPATGSTLALRTPTPIPQSTFALYAGMEPLKNHR